MEGRRWRAAGQGGFSLIEILVALLLLLITVTVVGSGLIGALQMERQTVERRAAEPLAEWVSARHASGLSAEDLIAAFEERPRGDFPDATIGHKQRKAADDSVWDQWTIRVSPEAPAVTLELLSNPAEPSAP